MKKLFLSLFALLALTLVSSCNNEEPLFPDDQPEEVTTRGEAHYVTQTGEIVWLWYVYNKSYVVFHSSNKDIVLSKLQAMGIEATDKMVQESDLLQCSAMFDVKTKAFDAQQEYLHIQVEGNYEKILEIPEVSYACPFLNDGNSVYPMTDLFYVYTDNAPSLEAMANENKAKVVGKIGGLGIPMWVVACDRYSTKNSLDMANAFSKSGLFDGAEPAVPSMGF